MAHEPGESSLLGEAGRPRPAPGKRSVRLAGAQLALCGMGGRMCWYALNVAIDLFSDIFGDDVYPQMLFVYNFAAMAGLVVQVLYDARLD
jgi:hypothetical protein